ncbi:MAG: leucine-rich repeat domain-containing protein [Dehalococcoidia bacterium]|nr:leucine-rich repeat domain-containing protein [Dehalococcoidia bacterium]
MKKFSSILLVTLSFLLLVSCDKNDVALSGIATSHIQSTNVSNTRDILTHFLDEPGNGSAEKLKPELSNELIEQMFRDYAKYLNNTGNSHSNITPDMLYINAYYGTFNGNIVVSVWGKEWAGTADMNPYVIEGYLVAELGSGSQSVMVYTGDTFVGIYEAYGQGLLNYQDIRAMAFSLIRSRYVWRLREIDKIEVSFNDVGVVKYYGKHNGHEIVAMGFMDTNLAEEAKEIEVAGYVFKLPAGSVNLFYTYGYFEDLAHAYERSGLTKETIVSLYAKHFNAAYEVAGAICTSGDLLYRYNPQMGGIEIMGFDWTVRDGTISGAPLNIVIPREIGGIPVKGIGEFAFNGLSASSSVSVEFPNSVTHVGESAFGWLVGLSQVNIPANVISVDRRAFWGNPNLTAIYKGKSYTAIKDMWGNWDLPREFYDDTNA